MQKRLLQEGLEVSRKPPVNYEEFSGDRSFIQLKEYIEPTYLCEMRNALVSPYGMVLRNGRVVAESVYSMFTGNRNALTFYKKIALGKVRRVAGDCLVVHNAYYDNYYHWTLEALPRLYSVREYAKDLTLLIHEKTRPFIEDYLAYFPFKDIVRVKDDEVILARKLWLPTHTARGLSHHERLVREMAAYLKARVPYDPAEHGPEKVFISRQSAAYRQAVNEPEVYSLFREHGFERIRLEDLKLTEQINLFRNVKMLSGIHGAGFSNLIYADGAEHLIDIIHERHAQNAFYTLAAALGVDYTRLECRGTGKTDYEGNDDLFVDLDKVRKSLSVTASRMI
jgi:capsular polysaccharide biosynthesis protein